MGEGDKETAREGSYTFYCKDPVSSADEDRGKIWWGYMDNIDGRYSDAKYKIMVRFEWSSDGEHANKKIFHGGTSLVEMLINVSYIFW